MTDVNRYVKIIEEIFVSRYKAGKKMISFEREDIERAATKLGIKLPKNLGDLIYSFRYRIALPARIQSRARKGKTWTIQPAGRSKYAFVEGAVQNFTPNPKVEETKIADATPGIVSMYSFNDEQALLAKIRYNRLIDTFTGTTCYSLQNHLRTTVPGMGQVETDELYVGVDTRGAHYVFPVQAKGPKDHMGIVQIRQDVALCAQKFSKLICCPIAAQHLADDLIALFSFKMQKGGDFAILDEKHYRLVPAEDISEKDTAEYAKR